MPSDTIWHMDLHTVGPQGSEASQPDFAVLVTREENRWEVEVLPQVLAGELDGLLRILRQQPSPLRLLLAAVGDDFFVALRAVGSDVAVFLSDVTASVDWELARQILG